MINPDPTPVVASIGPIEQAAIDYAKRWHLIDDDGVLWCIKRCGRRGTVPSLCCGQCLAAFRGGWK